jgi:hypothetical protein
MKSKDFDKLLPGKLTFDSNIKPSDKEWATGWNDAIDMMRLSFSPIIDNGSEYNIVLTVLPYVGQITFIKDGLPRADCPFCHSKNDFLISLKNNIAYCFGCHKGGNPIRFIMEKENLSYVEATKFLDKNQ